MSKDFDWKKIIKNKKNLKLMVLLKICIQLKVLSILLSYFYFYLLFKKFIVYINPNKSVK